MVMTDPLGDMLSRIKNGLRVKKLKIEIPYSKTKLAIIKILKERNLIENIKIISSDGVKKTIIVYPKYDSEGNPLIYDLVRISRPGRRIYMGYRELAKTRNNLSFRIISTSRGIMTDEEARRRKLGGEVICEIK